jgi:hypothetical protein
MIPLFPRCLILRVATLKQDERSLPGGVVSPIQSCFPEFDEYRQFVKRNPPVDRRQEQRLLAKIRRYLRSLSSGSVARRRAGCSVVRTLPKPIRRTVRPCNCRPKNFNRRSPVWLRSKQRVVYFVFAWINAWPCSAINQKKKLSR